MKTNDTFIIGIIALAFTTSSYGAVQIFNSTTAFRPSGIAFTWEGVPQGINLSFGTVYATTTIEFDVTTQQIRAHGTTSGMAIFTATAGMSQSQIIGYNSYTPPFPAPPIPVLTPIYRDATLSVSATVTIPTFSFDTGVQTFAWDGIQYAFSGPANIEFSGQLAISHTMTTGSETHNGSENYALDYIMGTGVWNLVTSGYPTSLGVVPGYNVSTTFPARGLESLTAANGFVHSLAVIPEPSIPLSLFAAGGAFCLLRRRK